MGRLAILTDVKNRVISKVRMRRILSWLGPILLALVLTFGLSRPFAQAAPTPDELAAYLETNSLEVGIDSVSGRQQVYYIYNGDKIFITSDDFNHIQPISNKQYIAWIEIIDGKGQLFLYNALTGAVQQVTSSSNNERPALSNDGRVVWERWIDEKWQIFYYDGGTLLKQLSFDDFSVRPTIYGNNAAFAQLSSSDGLWHVITYDLTTDQTQSINSSDGGQAWPQYNDDGSLATDRVR
jgi:hypothetical protein